jgi:hypothetical protein
MAGGMILMGVLLALLPLPAAMMLHGISQLAANGWRAFMLWRQIDWRVIRGYCAGAACALALFLALRLVGREARRAHRHGTHALHRAGACPSGCT